MGSFVNLLNFHKALMHLQKTCPGAECPRSSVMGEFFCHHIDYILVDIGLDKKKKDHTGHKNDANLVTELSYTSFGFLWILCRRLYCFRGKTSVTNAPLELYFH